jgi:Concanavalin A-like lectin/glucanases superfamily
LPTKFYLHRDAYQYAGTMPATNASASPTAPTWTPGQTNSVVNTPLLTNLSMTPYISTQPQNSLAYTTDNVATAQAQPLLRFVSQPLAAQTIAAQSVVVAFGLSASATASDFRTTQFLGVWRPSTGARVATLYNAGISNAATTSQANVANMGMSTSAFTCQAGDVLVYEIWRNVNVQTMGTSYTNTIFYDGQTEASVTNVAAFIQFTNNITLYTPTIGGTYGGVIGAESALRHYWRFDEPGGPILDYKGADHLDIGPANQTNITLAVATTPELGNVGAEGLANGAQGRVIGMCTDVVATTAWTVEFWVFLAAAQTQLAVLAASKGPNEGGWTIQCTTVGFQVQYGFSVSSSANMLATAFTPTYGTWQHLALTYSGVASGGELRFYVDGALVSPVINAPSWRPNTIPQIAFLNSNYSGIETSSIDGKLDEAAFYNAELSAATIQAHVSAGKITMPTPVAQGPVDLFNDKVIGTGLWTPWATGGTQQEYGSWLAQSPPFSPATGYVGVVSNSAYDFTNKAAIAQLDQPSSNQTGSQAYLRCEVDANNAVIIGVAGNAGTGWTLFMQHQLGGSTTTVDTEPWVVGTRGLALVFDTAQNKMWFATSDGFTWTARFSEAIPIATTALKVVLGAGCYQAIIPTGEARWESTGTAIVPWEHVGSWIYPSATATGTITAIRYKNVAGAAAGQATTTATPSLRRSLVASAAGVAVARASFAISGLSRGVAVATGTINKFVRTTPLPFLAITDDFNDGAMGAQWANHDIGDGSSGGKVETAGRLLVSARLNATNIAQNGYISTATYDLTGKAVQVELLGRPSTTSQITALRVEVDATHYIEVGSVHAGNYWYAWNNGVSATNSSSQPWPANARFIRIEHDQYNAYLEYSIDGSTWTPFAVGGGGTSVGVRTPMGPITAVKVILYTGSYYTQLASTTTAQFDSLNVKVRNLTGTATGTSTASAPTILVKRGLFAASPGTSTAAASLTVLRGLIASAAGKATASASFRDDYQTAILATPGLVGYWRVSEPSGTVAADASGGGHPGTFVGGVTLNQPGAIATAPAERAIKFNATDSYLVTPNVPASNAFSVEVWVKSGGTVWNQHGWLSSARVANGFVVHPMVGTINIGFYLVGSDGVSYVQVGGDTPVPNPQNWHHIVFTWNGANSGRAYIDGVQVMADIPSPITRTSGGTWPIYWGYDYNLAGRWGDGWIDEAAIYNVMLDGATVLAHYRASLRKVDVLARSDGQTTVNATLTRGRPLVAASAGRATITIANNRISRYRALTGLAAGFVPNTYRRLVMADTPFAYWRLDEPSGNWLDSSGNARNATTLGTILRQQPGALGEGYAQDLNGATPIADLITQWTGGTQEAGPQLRIPGGGAGITVRSPNRAPSIPFAGIWRWYVPLKIDVNNDPTDKDSFAGEYSIWNPSNGQIYHIANGNPNTSNKSYFPRDLSTTTLPTNWDQVGGQFVDFYWNGTDAIEFRNVRASNQAPNRTVWQGSGWIRSPGYVQTPYLAAFNGTTGWSVEMWLRVNAAWPTNYDMGLFVVGDAFANGQMIHLVARGGGGLACAFYNDDYNSGTAPSVGAWHHVVFSFGGPSNKIQRIHLDGVQLNGNFDRPTTYTPAIATGAATGNGAQVGVYQGGFFPGLLDDVAVYAYQLSRTQVVAHYQAGPLAPTPITRVKYLTVASRGTSTTTAFIYGGTPGDEYGAAVVAGPNLIAYWRLGDRAGTTAFDSAPGHAHPATYVGTPALGTGGALTSQVDSAADFNGTTNYVDIPDFAVTGSFTVEAWFKADTWAGGSYCLINRRTAANIGGFSLEINAGQPFFHVYSSNWSNITNASRVLALGVWHHVVGVYASNGQGLLMVDGEDVGRTTTYGTINNPGGALFRIGFNIGGNIFADGIIDEVAIYGTTLADATIQSHYRLGVKARSNYGLAVERTAGLVGRWTFDEAGGSLIQDHTGNGRTAVISGTATTWGSGIGGDYSGVGSGNMRYFQAAGSGVADARALPLAQFSVEVWFYPIGIQPVGVGSAPCIVTDVYNASNINYALWMDGNSLILRGAVHEGAVGWALMTGNVTLVDSAWAHIVLTYDNAYLRLYVNGVEAATPGGPRAGPFLSPGIGLRFGRRWDLADYVNGIIDEVALYNRPLTLTEVKEHTAKGFGTPWKIDLTGTAAGKTTLSVLLEKWEGIIGSSAGTSTASGAISRVRPLVAASVGSSSVAVTLQRKRPVAGTSPGVATVTGTTTGRRSLAVASTGTSTVSVALQRIKNLVAGAVGIGTSSGAASRRRPLVASSVGLSTATAATTRRRPLVALSAGLSTATAATTAYRRLAGTSVGLSVAYGRMAMSGLAIGRATIAGQVTARRSLVAVTTGVAAVAASPTRIRRLVASSAAASTASGSPSRRRPVLAASAGVASTSALLSNRRLIGGTTTAVGAASVSTLVSAYRRLAPVAAPGVATTVGLITRVRRFQSVSAAGVATVAGQPGKVRLVVGSAAGKTTITGQVTRYRRINPVSASNGYTLMVAFIGRKRTLTPLTVIVGTSTSNAKTTARRGLFAAPHGVSTASGIVGRYLGMQHVLWEYHGAQFIFPPSPGMHEVIWDEPTDQFVLDPHESEITQPG